MFCSISKAIYTGSPLIISPLFLLGGWLNGNISRSLDNLKQGIELAGSDEAESDSFSKVISIVAMYAGNDSLNEKIEQAVRTTLNNDKAVSYLATL